MLLDLETSLPGDMLCKVDRASMKYSVEMRSPLLDKDVVEYAFRIPQKYKYASGKKKYILKELTYDYVPATLLDRPKMGFSVPIDKWMRCHLKDRLMEYSDTAFLKNQGLFNAEYTSRLVRGFLTDTLPADMTCDGNSSLVWAFFVFQQWYERYLG
jgi:asparagine synthase (glutamine-hydrolysing)